MMDFIMWYVSVAAAFYIICSVRQFVRKDYIWKHTYMDIFRGLAGSYIWPWLIWNMNFTQPSAESEE
jgi:hypothetical protein